MHKKTFISLVLLFIFGHSFAQNIQLHYDFRHSLYGESAADRAGQNFLFSTVEMFHPDKYGSTFLFVDMAYAGEKGAVSSAYWEIARELRFWEAPFAAHIEYNGGVSHRGEIPNAYLMGASYQFKIGKAHWNTYLTYKYNAFARTSHDVQWTAAWQWTTLAGKLSLCGFVDIWTENKNRKTGAGGKQMVIISQPQCWFNAFPHFSVGSEVEVSWNFYSDSVFVLPTLAAKWTF